MALDSLMGRMQAADKLTPQQIQQTGKDGVLPMGIAQLMSQDKSSQQAEAKSSAPQNPAPGNIADQVMGQAQEATSPTRELKLQIEATRRDIDAIQKGVQGGHIPSYVGIPALKEKVDTLNKLEATLNPQQGIPAVQNAPVQGIAAAPSNLPAQGYAPGGIVAFADNEDQPVSSDMPTNGVEDIAPADVAKATREAGEARLKQVSPTLISAQDAYIQSLMKPGVTYAGYKAPTPPAPAPAPAPAAPVSNPAAATPVAPVVKQNPVAPNPAAPATPTGGVESLFGKDALGQLQLQAYKDMQSANLKAGKAQDYLDMQRQQIEDQAKQRPWMAMLKAGTEMMGGTSPHPFVNVGKGLTAGVDDYAKAEAAERAEKKLLLQYQTALDQADYAKKAGNFNALEAIQGRLNALKVAGINAANTRQAALDVGHQRNYGELVAKLMYQNGMSADEASATADKIYSNSSNIPQGVTITKRQS